MLYCTFDSLASMASFGLWCTRLCSSGPLALSRSFSWLSDVFESRVRLVQTHNVFAFAKAYGLLGETIGRTFYPLAGSRAIVWLPDDGDARQATVTIAFPPGLSTGQELTVALEV